MSDYHKNHNNDDHSSISWIWVIIAFACFWPVGIGLLLYKLSQDAKFQDKKKDWINALDGLSQRHEGTDSQTQAAQRQAQGQAQRYESTDSKSQAAQRQAQRQTQRQAQAATAKKWQPQATKSGQSRSDRRSPASLKGGTALSIVGASIALLFGMITGTTFLEWMPGNLWWALQDCFVPFFCTGVGVGLFAWGRFKHRRFKRLRRMMTMVGKQKVIDIRQLADAIPTSYSNACDDIQELIDGGYLGENAYINMATGQLFLDSDGFQSAPQPQPEPALDHDQELLAEIRRVDEAIPDEEMSRKIRRIEECTEHILDYQKKHPEKASELHTFLDYYLPTTLKILNAYAELEQQGVEGENISTTKTRIESMMDSVVEGFEAQLDKLFEGSMLDISADISVMEKMLSRDGLAGNMKIKVPKAPDVPTETSQAESYTPTLTLDPNGAGAAAVQTAPEDEQKP